jgi:hypothetical protein
MNLRRRADGIETQTSKKPAGLVPIFCRRDFSNACDLAKAEV